MPSSNIKDHAQVPIQEKEEECDVDQIIIYYDDVVIFKIWLTVCGVQFGFCQEECGMQFDWYIEEYYPLKNPIYISSLTFVVILSMLMSCYAVVVYTYVYYKTCTSLYNYLSHLQ